ncbi:unnamed protein product [Ranitomeya imitator]|uniref:Protein kinase domain-containing protein n=1 Tax=Ranitomeya imitator TaxID=111125 RepID=A0ABN9M6F4_9NEOB|nr:unnamed protein product [Ranitomeya imitator]
MERHKDLVFLHQTLLETKGIGPKEAMRFMEEAVEVPQRLTCQDLAHITGLDYIGSGFTKVVVKGTLQNGKSIALKSVHGDGSDVQQCVRQYGDHAGCHRLATYKLQKEIALLQILRHPGIIQLHGQCYVNSAPSDIRVTAMLELGSPLEMIQLLQTPWEERFKYRQLVPGRAFGLGASFRVSEFRQRQAVLVVLFSTVEDPNVDDPKDHPDDDDDDGGDNDGGDDDGGDDDGGDDDGGDDDTGDDDPGDDDMEDREAEEQEAAEQRAEEH